MAAIEEQKLRRRICELARRHVRWDSRIANGNSGWKAAP
jgi:hypothetical protein